MVETVTSPIQLFDERRIARRVRKIAGEIAGAVGREFTVVSLLKGSFVFVADLVRALDRHGLTPRVEFMRLSSYGAAKKSSGEVRLIGAPPADIAGRKVVVVDDIADTGRSLSFAAKLVAEQNAAQVWSCVLLDKPSRREVACSPDFVGFTVDDLFVVGYGIDFDERFRHLPYIGYVE